MDRQPRHTNGIACGNWNLKPDGTPLRFDSSTDQEWVDLMEKGRKLAEAALEKQAERDCSTTESMGSSSSDCSVNDDDTKKEEAHQNRIAANTLLVFPVVATRIAPCNETCIPNDTQKIEMDEFPPLEPTAKPKRQRKSYPPSVPIAERTRSKEKRF